MSVAAAFFTTGIVLPKFCLRLHRQFVPKPDARADDGDNESIILPKWVPRSNNVESHTAIAKDTDVPVMNVEDEEGECTFDTLPLPHK